MALRAATMAAWRLGGCSTSRTKSSFLYFSIQLHTSNSHSTISSHRTCSNLFVSGLSKRTTTEGLREAFAKFGEVVSAKVVTDRISGYSKGYGFVRYATTEEATQGIKGMDGQFLDGWVIFAEYAKPRPPPTTQQQFGNPPFSSNGFQ